MQISDPKFWFSFRTTGPEQDIREAFSKMRAPSQEEWDGVCAIAIEATHVKIIKEYLYAWHDPEPGGYRSERTATPKVVEYELYAMSGCPGWRAEFSQGDRAFYVTIPPRPVLLFGCHL